ncbi:MAG: ATP-grasp domain-containing protein [Candidatus Cloacimonetes bacterium]|jgi:predicted ATP-grasp superfamily ATP-dependent carboligase|nr:ATP-grasp domain-containing protein [Candidatus Cloacimonadota bacterium]MDD4687657.1 ATP-grasp domain-containing protein [Candidatus Cloacimonadota bacterium]MDY0299473.1 ATP-grasp domain-containing protein [Candidatus Cloacimonadaceae bacterium]
MKKVFVTDGLAPATPAILESLFRSSYRVYVGESFSLNASFFSKFCSGKFVYPNPEVDKVNFVIKLRNYLKMMRINYLIPVSSKVIDAILSSGIDLSSEGIHFLLPDYDTWLIAEYKHKTLKIAEELGISMPVTVFDPSLSYQELVQRLFTPFIIKVSKSDGARGVLRVTSEREFNEYIAKCKSKCFQYFFQELIPLGGKSMNASYLYDKNGVIKAWFLMEKVRQYPIKGGSTSYSKSVYDENILNIGKNLLDRIGWRGVAEVEFIQDPRTMQWVLMEINPRFWNPLLLAIKSGVNYPALIMDLIDNRSIQPMLQYSHEIRFSFFPYELINLLKGNAKSVIMDMITKKSYDNYLKRSDPGLFWGLVVQSIYLMISRSEYIKLR